MKCKKESTAQKAYSAASSIGAVWFSSAGFSYSFSF